MEARHMYYSDPAHINLKAMQDSARKVAKGGQYVIIHHHRVTEICASTAGKYKHEEFQPEGDN